MLKKTKSCILAATAAGAMAVGMASAAHAAIIWEDGFNRSSSSTLGNGWVEVEDDYNDVAVISSDQMQLRDKSPDASATQYAIDLSGYENIVVEFKWSALNRDSSNSDKLIVSYRVDGTGNAPFSTLFTDGLGSTNWETEAFAIASAANTSDFDLRFAIDVSKDKEGARIDWVKITGDLIPTTQVPEPGVLGLLGLGLAGVSLAARRRAA